jgi:hypothetical protein
MQSTHWSALLKKLPVETHNQLSVVTMGGTEVMVQAILLTDGECLVFKGRLSASQDTGRLFFVPFDQIDFIGFNRLVGEDEFRAWFGETPAPANGAPAPQSNVSTKTPVPNRAALLERVRARTTSYGAPGQQTPSS